MKLLIIHGPNLNLIGLWASQNNQNITLDKLNQKIRKYSTNKSYGLNIIQYNNEHKIVSYIQKNRNKFDGIIINPGPLQQSGYILKDLLDLIKVPYVTVRCKKEEVNLLSGIRNIYSENIYNGYIESIDYITKAIK